MFANSFDRLLYLWLHQRGLMGAAENRLYRHLLRPGMNAADVGANVGLYSHLFSSLVGPTGTVTAFEPAPYPRACLKAAARRNRLQNLHLIPCAVSDVRGRADFAIDALHNGNSHLVRGSSRRGQPSVRTDRLDACFKTDFLDLVKIDVQGWEPLVLRGMEGLLAGSHQPVIVFEVCLKMLRNNGFEVGDCLAPLRSAGLIFQLWNAGQSALRNVADNEILSLAEMSSYFDIVAVPSRPLPGSP